jgi:uncharacterized membrane protein
MRFGHITRYFVRGALIIVPFALTIYSLYFVFVTIDRILPFDFPGLGLLVTFVAVTLVGFLSSNVIGSTFVGLGEQLLRKVPLVALIYSSIKDLIDAFVGEKRRFDQPVSVALNADGSLKALGFVTRRNLTALGFHGHVAVYFPQSYNFAGNLVLVPATAVTPVDVSSAELMTFIVSGGVSGLGIGAPTLQPPRQDGPKLGGE